MTSDTVLVLLILAAAVLLFITEWLRVDLIALLMLASLALTGLVTPEQALSGFSNPAVVTVWAVLILSGALSKTGVANLIGKRFMQWGGSGERKLLLIITTTAGLLSGFMNSIGVASLFLPVIIDISKKTRRPPSKLLMPLAYASLLGGSITLIGTPPNLLVSEALHKAGLEPFGMFDFTPIGLIIMFAGIIVLVTLGYRLLPARDITKELGNLEDRNALDLFELQKRMGVLQIPSDSALIGKSLADSRLGLALGLNVIAILRGNQTRLAPSPQEIIKADDRLLVEGRLDRLSEIHQQKLFSIENDDLTLEKLTSPEVELFEFQILTDSPFENKTLGKINFRRRFGPVVLAIRRGQDTWRTNLESITLHHGDVLLAHGTVDQIDALKEYDSDLVFKPISTEIYHLEDRLMMLRIQPDSALVNKSLIESRLGEAYGLGVMGIIRQGQLHLIPDPDSPLEAGDLLLVKGKPADLLTVQGLLELQISSGELPDLPELESEQIGLNQAVLSPYTTLVGKTLRELNFRSKYGLNILAIWREGQAYRSDLGNLALRFGDALLLYGPREKVHVLGKDPDFLVLTEDAQEAPRSKKAPIAILIMAAVLLPAIFGWINIAIAAIAGVVLMVLTGCISMDEAYRSIQLRALFLIAGMLPLGTAMQNTGTAQLLANGMVSLIGGWGPQVVAAGLFILAALASQVMPNPAVAVLLAPIAINTAAELGISPYPLMMAVAISASAAFLSPVGHPANVLVMGPGGYKFSDYVKVGLPLTIVVLIVTILALPIFWPY
jgi:di/tricarboxylate transporter